MRSHIFYTLFLIACSIWILSFAVREPVQNHHDQPAIHQVVVGESLQNSVPVSLFGEGLSDDLSVHLVHNYPDVQRGTMELWGIVHDVSYSGNLLVSSNGDMGITLLEYEDGNFFVRDSIILGDDILSSIIKVDKIISLSKSGVIYISKIIEGKIYKNTEQKLDYNDKFYDVLKYDDKIIFLSLNHVVISSFGKNKLDINCVFYSENVIRRIHVLDDNIFIASENGKIFVLNKVLDESVVEIEYSGLVMDIADYNGKIVFLVSDYKRKTSEIIWYDLLSKISIKNSINGVYSHIVDGMIDNKLALIGALKNIILLNLNENLKQLEIENFVLESNIQSPFAFNNSVVVGATSSRNIFIMDINKVKRNKLDANEYTIKNIEHDEHREIKVGQLCIEIHKDKIMIVNQDGGVIDTISASGRHVVCVGDGYLVLAEDSKVLAFEISSEGFRLVGTHSLQNRFIKIAYHDGLFYGSIGRNGIVSMHVSASGISQIEKFDFPWPYGGVATAFHLLSKGDYLYVSSVTEGLWILKNGDKKHLVVDEQIQDGYSYSHLGEFGGMVYASDRNIGVRYFSPDKKGFPVLIDIEEVSFVRNIREENGELWAIRIEDNVKLSPPNMVLDVHRFTPNRLIFTVPLEYLDGDSEIVVRSGRSVLSVPLPRNVALH